MSKAIMRLTTREERPHGAEGISVDRLTGSYCRGEFECTAIVERLAEYENAEEDGRLLLLPCPLGTPVYEIKKIINYGEVEDKATYSYYIDQTTFTVELIAKFDKTVFFTYEKAEKVLGEIEDEDSL